MSLLSKKLLIIIGLSLVAFCFRAYQVSNLPAILNRDEAALAYNAYLLDEVGQDEWQRGWDITLESFGDYKLIGYPAHLVGVYQLFELRDSVVRLPSIIAGSLLVLVAYGYSHWLKIKGKWRLLLPALVVMTPVFFFYSRMAYEANLALMYFALAALIFLDRSILKSRRTVAELGASLLLLVATLTYNTPLLLIPVLLVTVVISRSWKQPRTWLRPVGLMTLIFVLMMWQLLSLTSQKAGITIFTDQTVWTNYTQIRAQLPPLLATFFSKYLYYGWLMLENTVQSFSPFFLVQQGGSHPWHSIPNFGHLQWTLYFSSIVGVVHMAYLAMFKRKKRYLVFILLLLGSLVPSVITVDAPHTTRSLYFLFLLTAAGAWEIAQLYHQLQVNPKLKTVLFVVFLTLLTAESGRYFYHYFSVYPTQQNEVLKAGFDRVVQDVNQEHPQAEVAVVDEEGYHYILLAWYLRIPPQEYFQTVVRQQPNQIGFRYGEQVGRYHFIAKQEDRSPEEKVLVFWNKKQNEWQYETN